jgi:ABC-type transport system involved in multi-copper enzyme maturation permease subunit
MLSSYLSALTTMRRRSTAVLLGLMAALGALTATLAVSTIGNGDSRLRGGPPGSTSLSTAAAEAATGWGDILGQSGQLIGVIALCIAASSVAGEYNLGTWRNLLVRQPLRMTLMGGKLAAIATVVTTGTLIAAAASAVVGILAASGQGVDTTAWLTADGFAGLAGTAGNLVLSALGYASVGVALGVVLRSPTMAIGAGLAWLLPLETLSGLALGDTADWLPGRLLAAVASGGTETIAYGTALAAAAAVLLVCVGGSLGCFARQELS